MPNPTEPPTSGTTVQEAPDSSSESMAIDLSGDQLCDVWQATVICPPITAQYTQELLWTLPNIESVSEIYRSNREHDVTQPSDLEGLRVVFRFESEVSTVQVIEPLEALFSTHPKLGKRCTIEGVQPVTNADWEDQWKQYWHPTPITQTLTIRPTWETYTPKSSDERVIILDPECAFGTGTHETTRLMLEVFESYAKTVDLAQKNIIDIGTGSGILAIDAALLGCKDVKGLDNDSAAVETAKKNAELNGVASSMDFTDTPLAELCQTKYDIVLINIIAPVILELWPDIMLRLNAGGTLIASGLIEKSVGSVEAAMKDAGFTDIQQFRQGDWFALQGNFSG